MSNNNKKIVVAQNKTCLHDETNESENSIMIMPPPPPLLLSRRRARGEELSMLINMPSTPRAVSSTVRQSTTSSPCTTSTRPSSSELTSTGTPIGSHWWQKCMTPTTAKRDLEDDVDNDCYFYRQEKHMNLPKTKSSKQTHLSEMLTQMNFQLPLEEL